MLDTTLPSVPGATKMRTFPAITTTSKRRSGTTAGSARSPSIHWSPGAFWRAASSMPGSMSTPTTSRPRRLSSMATLPVPHPASSTEPAPKDSTKEASPCMSAPLAASSSNLRSYAAPRGTSPVIHRLVAIHRFWPAGGARDIPARPRPTCAPTWDDSSRWTSSEYGMAWQSASSPHGRRSPGGSSARQYVCSMPPQPPMGSTATSSSCALRGPRPRSGPRSSTWRGPPRAA